MYRILYYSGLSFTLYLMIFNLFDQHGLVDNDAAKVLQPGFQPGSTAYVAKKNQFLHCAKYQHWERKLASVEFLNTHTHTHTHRACIHPYVGVGMWQGCMFSLSQTWGCAAWPAEDESAKLLPPTNLSKICWVGLSLEGTKLTSCCVSDIFCFFKKRKSDSCIQSMCGVKNEKPDFE